MFNDRKSAREMLGALQSEKHIMAGCLYDRRGKVFAEYRRPGLPRSFEIPSRSEDGARFDKEKMTLSRQVIFDQTNVGAIAIVSDLSVLQAKTREYVKISALVLLLSVLLAYIVSSPLLHKITSPMLPLAGLGARASSKADYSLQAAPEGNDEAGALTGASHAMSERVEESETALVP